MNKDELLQELTKIYPILKEVDTKNRNVNRLNSRINALKSVEYKKDDMDRNQTFIKIVLVCAIIFYKMHGIIIGYILGYLFCSKYYKDYNEIRKNKIRTEYQRLEGVKQKMSEELYDYIEKYYGWITNILSEEHAYTFCVERLIIYLKSGRADNLKEALNLYETELHHMRMEEQMNNMMKEIQEQSKQLYAIKAEVALARMAAQSAAENAEYVSNHY